MKYLVLVMAFINTAAYAEQYIVDSLGNSSAPLHMALAYRAQQLTLSDNDEKVNNVLIVNSDDGVPSLNRSDFVHADTIILVGKENENVMVELLGYGVSAPLVIIHNANNKDRREISRMTSINMSNVAKVAERVFEQISIVDKGRTSSNDNDN